MLPQQSEPLDLPTLRMREATIAAGIWLTFGLAAFAGVYVGLTWSHPHRTAIATLWGIGVAAAALVSLLPSERIVHSRGREPFFLAWSLMDAGMLTAAAALDGGTASPLALIIFLPVVFSAMSYPRASVLTVGVASVIGYLALALAVGGEPLQVEAAFLTVLASMAAVSAWQANNHKRQHTALRHASRTDSLTGCLNRRGFEERAAAELKTMRRNLRQGAVVVIDLDHFKLVNDRHGHAAGDELLCWVADTLGATVRPNDAVGRLGGDEFAVFMADIGPGPAHAGMVRLRSALRERTACASGLAVYPDDGTDLDTLTREADLRLYAAREARDGSGSEAAVDHAFVPAASAARGAHPHAPASPGAGLADLERLQSVLLEEIDAAVVVSTPDGIITSWNRGAEELYGWSREDAIGRYGRDLVVPAERDTKPREIKGLVRDSRWDGEMILKRRDGSTFPAQLRSRLILDADGRPAAIVTVTTDISAQASVEESPLGASRHYAEVIAHSMGEGLFALDAHGRVTYINPVAEELLGYPRGELIGQRMHDIIHARRSDGSALAAADCPIMRAVSDGSLVRMDDDEFMTRSGRMLPVSYTAAPFTGADAGRGCVVIFRDNSQARRVENERRRDAETLACLETVEQALAEDRLLLYSQPIVELASGRTIGHELLMRLRERDGTILAPGPFLQVAERFAIIGEIDWWVIKRGIRIAAEGTPVEINISARSVGDIDVLEYVERCLDEHSPPAGSVVFELTETALMEDEGGARQFAERVRALGCKVALDDFGTGYGGLSYLKQLPVDILKIDIEFVRDLASSQASRHVVQAVVALARDFDLRTVAEGVEDAQTLELLAELGVDFAQGFHIAEPAPFARRPGDSSRPPHVAARALRMAVRAGAAAVH